MCAHGLSMSLTVQPCTYVHTIVPTCPAKSGQRSMLPSLNYSLLSVVLGDDAAKFAGSLRLLVSAPQPGLGGDEKRGAATSRWPTSMLNIRGQICRETRRVDRCLASDLMLRDTTDHSR